MREKRVGKKAVKKWIGLMVAVSLAVEMCGCGKGSAERSPDTPWNNGYYAIMETETGYYNNLVGQQCLSYYEKETGTEIFLCAKPECQHDGSESCTATYRNMRVINSVLYEGVIYILSVERKDDVVSFNLYRAALDGSTLDKVGEVFSTGNVIEDEVYITSANEPVPFIIHKGYAYIPFFIAVKWSQKGFVNGGIMKMDIQSGKTEQIYEIGGLTEPYPVKLWGIGDYLYFDVSATAYRNGSHGTYRYHIPEGNTEYVFNILYPEEKAYDFYVDIVTEDGILYNRMQTQEGIGGITSYDLNTGEWLGSILLQEDDGVRFEPMLFEDRFYICGEDAVSVYSMEGERLGRLAYDFPGVESDITYSEAHLKIKISQGRLYAVYENPYYVPIYAQTSYKGGYHMDNVLYSAFACSLEELIAGGGKWELAYFIKDKNLPQRFMGGRVLYSF